MARRRRLDDVTTQREVSMLLLRAAVGARSDSVVPLRVAMQAADDAMRSGEDWQGEARAALDALQAIADGTKGARAIARAALYASRVRASEIMVDTDDVEV